jgi:PAS domain S-box-containing protein
MEHRRLSQTADRSDSLFAPTRAAANGTAPRPRYKEGVTEELLWRHGFAGAADGAFVVTTQRRIALWNPAAERITGYEATEVLGRPCCDIFAGRDSNDERFCCRRDRLPSLLGGGSSVESFDMPTFTKGGRPIWLNMSTVVLAAASPRDLRILRTFRDVTPVKDMLALIRDRLAGAPAKQDPVARLTRREAELLRLMASGATNRMLATRLHISPATVRNHTHNIFEKLGVHTRVAAVCYALSQLMI